MLVARERVAVGNDFLVGEVGTERHRGGERRRLDARHGARPLHQQTVELAHAGRPVANELGIEIEHHHTVGTHAGLDLLGVDEHHAAKRIEERARHDEHDHAQRNLRNDERVAPVEAHATGRSDVGGLERVGERR